MPYSYTSRIKPKITEEVDARIREVFQHFPEFDSEEIRIGTITSRKYGTAEVGGNKINLRVGRIHPYKQTIAHELVHLLQGRMGSGIPGGERPADLWVCARSAELLDDVPNYLELPITKKDLESAFTRRLITNLAKKAIKERENGNRRYIKWFEAEVDKLLSNDRK